MKFCQNTSVKDSSSEFYKQKARWVRTHIKARKTAPEARDG